jgi:hypothetical protein
MDESPASLSFDAPGLSASRLRGFVRLLGGNRRGALSGVNAVAFEQRPAAMRGFLRRLPAGGSRHFFDRSPYVT